MAGCLQLANAVTHNCPSPTCSANLTLSSLCCWCCALQLAGGPLAGALPHIWGKLLREAQHL